MTFARRGQCRTLTWAEVRWHHTQRDRRVESEGTQLAFDAARWRAWPIKGRQSIGGLAGDDDARFVDDASTKRKRLQHWLRAKRTNFACQPLRGGVVVRAAGAMAVDTFPTSKDPCDAFARYQCHRAFDDQAFVRTCSERQQRAGA